jgi:hypothetical protein
LLLSMAAILPAPVGTLYGRLFQLMDFLELLFGKRQPRTPKRIMTQTSKMFELDI